MRTVTIMCSRYHKWGMRLFRAITGERYNHVSFSLDDGCEIFYSFNLKGFAVEKPRKHYPATRVPGSAYVRIEVPDEVWGRLHDEVERFRDHADEYAYTRLGFLLCLLHLPRAFPNRLFCSQFVASVLERAGVVRLRKPPEAYLPQQLMSQVDYLYPTSSPVACAL